MQAVSESGRIRVKNNRLFKTNAVISLILLIGFALTAALSYHANYRTSLDSMEQISTLTADGICYQLTAMFTKPVNVSLTMSHDSLLREHLSKETDTGKSTDSIPSSWYPPPRPAIITLMELTAY